MKRTLKFILLVLSIILTFIFGIEYESNYRIMTRNTIKYLANYELEFYAVKTFRLFEADVAFILILIPIGFYIINRKISSLKKVIRLVLMTIILIPLFYYLFCYFESLFIRTSTSTSTSTSTINNQVLKYHQNKVSYRMILFLTIVSVLISGNIIKKTKTLFS